MTTYSLESTVLPMDEVLMNTDRDSILAYESSPVSASSPAVLARSTDDMEQDDEVGASPDPADVDEDDDEDIDDDEEDDDEDLDADEEDDEDEDEDESDVLKT